MKKILTVLLVLMMVVAFAACTEDTGNASDADVQTPVASTPDVDTPNDSEEEVEPPVEVKVMTYEEYMAAELDTQVCVETYVQAHQAWWNDSVVIYAQGPDGGYFFYNIACSEADAEKLVPGTKIRVTGIKANYSGEVEINGGAFTFIEGADTYIAEALDVTNLLGTDEMINHQNKLVSFKGMTVESIEFKNGEPGDDIYVTLSKDGNSYSFCVEAYFTGADTDVYKAVSALVGGEMIDVEGFLYWYEGMNPHITSIELVEAL